MSQQGKNKTKSLLDFYTEQKFESFLAYFIRILNSCVVLQDSILQTGGAQPVQPHTFYARLLVLDKTLAQPHFSVVNCSDAVMSVFHYPVLTCRLIFLRL